MAVRSRSDRRWETPWTPRSSGRWRTGSGSRRESTPAKTHAPPRTAEPMDRSGAAFLPASPMMYAGVSDPAIVDNPNIPSNQPHVHASDLSSLFPIYSSAGGGADNRVPIPPSKIESARMSEVFEGYERQYCEISASLSRKCTGASALDGEQKKQKVSEIKSGIDDAETLIRKMDLEARSLQPSVKAALLAKIREYKSDLNNLKSEVKRLTSSNANATREELLESGMADTLKVSADQRDRLLMSTERLNHSSERIKESRRTMFETEELGVSILQDLHQQRQSLLHAHNTLHGVDDNIGKSRKILTSMSRRMDRNKWIIGCVIVVLVLAILLILYFKLFH